MFKSIWSDVLIVLVFILELDISQNALCIEPVRTWTTKDGKTLEGRWTNTVDEELKTVCIADGDETYEIAFMDLSSTDKKYIKHAKKNFGKSSKSKKASSKKTSKRSKRANDEADSIDPSQLKAGERMVKTINGVDYVFHWCPPGTFTMGSPSNEVGRGDDETQHQVTLTQGFWMLETEVTQQMWNSVMKSSRGDRQDYPAEWVSWNDCQEFLHNLDIPGWTLSLPTEAQWEYACRAGTTGAFAANLDTIAWYKNNSNGGSHPVAQKKPNAWGLYDMHGSIYEWCNDFYGRYPTGSVTNPTGPTQGSERVCRGGGRHDTDSCRSANRASIAANTQTGCLGFRFIATKR